MTEPTESIADSSQVLVEGELTIYSVTEQKNRLLGELANCRTLALDLSAVGEFDSAGLQLLWLLKREAQLRQRQLQLINHSRAVTEVLELLGLHGQLESATSPSARWSKP